MGHGRTVDNVDRPFHYHDMAEDTVELMRQLEIERGVVVGYSDGGSSVSTWRSTIPRA
jgi:pimeloyl-ACP methyl ester carboxylesterase